MTQYIGRCRGWHNIGFSTHKANIVLCPTLPAHSKYETLDIRNIEKIKIWNIAYFLALHTVQHKRKQHFYNLRPMNRISFILNPSVASYSPFNLIKTVLCQHKYQYLQADIVRLLSKVGSRVVFAPQAIELSLSGQSQSIYKHWTSLSKSKYFPLLFLQSDIFNFVTASA